MYIFYRLFTLTALRRRGFPPEAINNFCAQMGITGAQAIIDPAVLEASVRDVLNLTASRHMVVLEPLKVTISNFPHENAIKLTVPNFPNEPDKGQHDIVFDEIVYIEASDFKEVRNTSFSLKIYYHFIKNVVAYLQKTEKDFRRLTLNQSVGLKHVGIVLKIKEIKKDNMGNIINLIVTQEPICETNKPKAFIHWVSNPLLASIRLYERL